MPARDEWSDDENCKTLADLAVLWLKSDADPRVARARSISTRRHSRRAGAEAEGRRAAAGAAINDRRTGRERQLEFVARRTIGKYGCFGCHDIPGFEDAKPIGTALVDWGRKETSKLAFENIHKFLETHGINPEQPTDGGAAARPRRGAAQPREEAAAARRRRRATPARCTPSTSIPATSSDKPRATSSSRSTATAATASCGRSCASRGATTTRRRATRTSTSGCACRGSRSTTSSAKR